MASPPVSSVSSRSTGLKLTRSDSKTSLSSSRTASSLFSKNTSRSFLEGPRAEKRTYSINQLALEDKTQHLVSHKMQDEKSIADELMIKAEKQQDRDGMNAEQRLCHLTETGGLIKKTLAEMTCVTDGLMKSGGSKRNLLSAVIELEAESWTLVTLPLGILFFIVCTCAFGLHYNTPAIFLQETSLRRHVLDAAVSTENAAAPGYDEVYSWLGQDWINFLWQMPNVEGEADSYLPSRDMKLIGGTMFRIIEGKTDTCKYVNTSLCYSQFERSSLGAAALNGWEAGVGGRRLADAALGRRLSPLHYGHDDAIEDEGRWSRGVTEAWFSFHDPSSFARADSEWINLRPRKQAALFRQNRPKAQPGRRQQRKKEHHRRPMRRLLKGGFEGLRNSRKKKASVRATNTIVSKAKPIGRARFDRRLTDISSDFLLSLPQAAGYDKSFTAVIPMSMQQKDVDIQVEGYKAASAPLLKASSLVFSAEALIMNPELKVLTHVSVNFLISRSGELYTQVILNSQMTEANAWGLAFLVIWALWLTWMLVQHIVEISVACRNGRASAHLLSGRVVIAWLLIILGWALVILQGVEHEESARTQNLIKQWEDLRAKVDPSELEALDVSWTRKIHSVAYLAAAMDRELVIVAALYHVIIMFHLLLCSKGHPRLGALVDTLGKCLQDIFHLFIVFLFVFMAYVFAGHTLFGSKLTDFSTVTGSIGATLEQAVSFMTNWDVITSEDMWPAAIWVWTLIMLVSLVIINVVLAVVFDFYSKVRMYITPEDTLLHTLRRRWKALKKRTEWYSCHNLLRGIMLIKAELITPEIMMETFKGITKEQVLQIFHLAELRSVSETVLGHKTLFGEVAASMLLCLDETRDGVRIMQSQEFVSNREAKIWLSDQQDILLPPAAVYDLGPGEYVILHEGLEVQSGESLSSDVIGALKCGDHTQIIQTLDIDEGPNLRRLRGKIATASGDGWISLNDPLSGLTWAKFYVPPVKEEDLPGLYEIIHDGSAVKQDLGMGSPQLGTMSKGTLVKIVEIVTDYYDNDMQCTRTRGRLAGSGWLSLLDQDLKYRFAKRCGEQHRCGQYEVIEDNIAVLSAPEEPSTVDNYLKKGGRVDIVEIRFVVNADTGEDRVMGRLQTGGWALLHDKRTGQTFVEISADDPAIKLSGLKPAAEEAAIPSFAPVWVKDGLLAHLQRQQRNMLDLTAKFQNMTQELEKKGMQTKQTSEIPTPMPDAPDFDVMLQPPRNGLKDGQAPLRRTEAVVNKPRSTQRVTSQSVKTRLAHFRLEI
eukprot:TRINITY_DN19867_c0_g2_i1.p1 TRINITY_DN19867_c0_g2~~TRINITY_DN19867_c0_g2_i1.p1  ORF type:complete len:1276 (-),score=221.43 TRINITY_DN19867_c0_g2_i1:455-4282(-)